ncbi:MAG TPA: hypothetical protein VL527_02365 [Dongiaceae bacterium]|nr:hypothetical protein [Dongiaceae bacterium]
MPSQQKLQIQAAAPTNYVVHVADAPPVPVAADGRVTFTVPSLPRGCSTYVLNFIKIGDGSPLNVRAIQVWRDGEIVRQLSLNQLSHLPADAEGYHILKLR